MPEDDKNRLRSAIIEIFTEVLVASPPDNLSFALEALRLRARYGMLGNAASLSEEEAHELWGLSTVSHVAWDLLVEHLTVRLAPKESKTAIPLPDAFKAFLVLRMRGDAERPKPKKRMGDTRDRNLYRDYVIFEMLDYLEALGFKKKPAAEIVYEAFQRAGHNMVSFDAIRHVQRNSERLSLELRELEEAQMAREQKAARNGVLGPLT